MKKIFIKIGMLWVSMKMEMKWILMEFLFISMEVQNYLHAGENGQIYVDKLTTKTIGTIVLTACDTGNLDYSNNVASQLAISQNVDQVIAPDGLGSLLSIGIVSSTYTKEKSDY